MELTLDQALQKGIEAHKAGKVQDADRYYTAILKANPKHPDANHNMGVLAVGVGKVEAALPFFKTGLEANPKIAQYWLSYIDALIKLDRIEGAKAVFDQAKSNGAKGDGFDQIEKTLNGVKQSIEVKAAFKKPQVPPRDKFQSLLKLYKQGHYQQALDNVSQLLKQFPYSFHLYNIMGATNKGLGKLDEAIEAFNKAISIKPDYAEGYSNLGVTLKEHGNPEEAIEAFANAISIKPDYAEAYHNLVFVLKDIVFIKPNKVLQKLLTSILDKRINVRPKDFAGAAISLLKLEPTLQKHFQLVDNEVIESTVDVISDLSEFPLLLKLMNVCPLPDLELEKLFKNLRFSILSSVLDIKEASPELLNFQSALALQCFTNEYIYNQTEKERKILQSLEASIKKSFKNNEQPTPQALLSMASYKALNQFDWCKLLVLTDDIKEVYSRQIEEPNHEEKLKQDLPVLDEITDNISSKVRAQYEESPYPRWVNLDLRVKPSSIANVFDESKLKLYDKNIEEVENPEILIAGCGTGQHSIATAKKFKSSKVLAIDLSLSSLAYAKRKTEELAIENIEHMQADILDLGQLNKQFDIIESGGVLHHMDNPMAGWRVLTDCLKPGGLMKIGLYSELARQHIVKIKKEINQKDIRATDSEMISFRDKIVKSNKDHHKLITMSPDFYSLSTLRDLLFHVQEHRFTLPLIKSSLDKLGLKFCGFADRKIVSHFTKTNKTKDDLYDLDKWQAYEEANPRAFAGMYQFWCQKVE